MYKKIILHLKPISHIGVVFIAALITVGLYTWFKDTTYFIQLQSWSQNNFLRLSYFLILLKIAGILWPPIPGVVLLVGSIPLVGWFPAYLYDVIGYLIGSSIAFYLSRNYGIRVIKMVFGQSGVDNVKKFKINPKHEIEAITLMKVFGGGIGEFISYGAGLTQIKFKSFMIGNIVASVVVGLPIFYFFSFAFGGGGKIYFAAIPLGVGVILFFLLRKRYFQWDEDLPA